MRKKEDNVLDLANVIGIPIITGKNDEYMWTGAVKSDKASRLVIRDDELRKEYIKLWYFYRRMKAIKKKL